MQEETRDTIPLWLAVAITVVVALPFGVWLGNYNIPIWASFIVWAEYFALGAKPAALKTMLPAYTLGVVAAAIIMIGYTLLSKAFGTGTVLTSGEFSFTYDNVALGLACFVGFCLFIYAMKYVPVTAIGDGRLVTLRMSVSGFWMVDATVAKSTRSFGLPSSFGSSQIAIVDGVPAGGEPGNANEP